MLERYSSSLQGLLPRGMDAARFKRTAWLVVRDNPRLLQADPGSIVAGIFRAGQLGLEFGPLGHAFLVPFKVKGKLVAQFILGYKGVVVLAHRSERVLDITARDVREGDEFDYSYGTDEWIRHKPVGDPDAPLSHTYAIGRYVGGGINQVVLTRKQVDSYRARSRAADDGPWVTDYPAMAMKTSVLRLAPFLPMTVEEARLIDASGDEVPYSLDWNDDGVVDVVPDPSASATVDPPASPSSEVPEPEAPPAEPADGP